MGALFIFIFISVLVISALLFFNKGEKAHEIKSILKDIYKNFIELFNNLKKLFLILKDLIQEKLDPNQNQTEDQSSSSETASPTEVSTTDSSESQPVVITEPEIETSSESASPTEVSVNEKSTDPKND